MLVRTGENAPGKAFEDGAVVGDHHDGRPFLVELAKQLQDPLGRLSVQVPGRFVGEDDLRPVQQGAGDGDALLLSAGELMRHLVGLGGHSDIVQHFGDPVVDSAAVLPAGGTEDEFQVGFHAAVHQQLEVLEYHAEAPAQHRYVFCTDVPQIESADGSFPAQEAVFRRHRADDGSFSRADLADDVDEVARHDGHVEAVDDDALPVEDVCAAESD